jgi:hypothetical protein
MGMNGQRALQVLEGILGGQGAGIEHHEVGELARHELIVLADPSALAWSRDLVDLEERHGALSAPRLREIVDALTKSLRSDLHRLFTRNTTLATEERDRAACRRLLGVFDDPERRARLDSAVTLTANMKVRPAKVVTKHGELQVGLTPLGHRVINALRARVERFAAAPLGEFLKRFLKAEGKIADLARDAKYLSDKLHDVSRGRSSVVAGLLKSGFQPDQALDRYKAARPKVLPGDKPTENPHLSVAAVRASAAGGSVVEAAGRQRDTYRALAKAGLPEGPVLRGAVRAVMALPQNSAPVERFRQLEAALRRSCPDRLDAVRFAARLVACPGTPDQLAKHATDAATLLESRQLGSRKVLWGAPVALASYVGPEASLESLVERYAGIVSAIRKLKGFHFQGEIPDPVADLVACAGTPPEIASLVRQMVSHLGSDAHKPGWAAGDPFAMACSFAKRYAY